MTLLILYIMSMESMEQEKLVMNYIKTMFQFRKSINHKLTSIDITNLIHQIINYKLIKSEIFSNIDENIVHNCMINFGFRFQQKTNYYIYSIGIKPPIQKLLKIHAEY